MYVCAAFGTCVLNSARKWASQALVRQGLQWTCIDDKRSCNCVASFDLMRRGRQGVCLLPWLCAISCSGLVINMLLVQLSLNLID